MRALIFLLTLAAIATSACSLRTLRGEDRMADCRQLCGKPGAFGFKSETGPDSGAIECECRP